MSSVENKAGAWQLAAGTRTSQSGEGHMVPSEVSHENATQNLGYDGAVVVAVGILNSKLEDNDEVPFSFESEVGEEDGYLLDLEDDETEVEYSTPSVRDGKVKLTARNLKAED